MAIQTQGFGGTVTEVDSTFRASRVTVRPTEVINWQTCGGTSGLITVLAAAGIVYAFRNTGANPILIRSIRVGFCTTTAFTAAQSLQYQLVKATGYTVSETVGTQLYTVGQNKHRGSMTNVSSAPSINIATTVVCSGGTRTLETTPMGMINGTVSTIGTTVPVQTIWSHDPEDYPWYLAQNEGFVILNGQVMGAGGVGNLQVLTEFSEVTSY
jgi:hypothetical protein